MKLIIIILLAIAAAIAVLYNRLVRARNRVDSAWSDIDVQLQRRHDLIPQLVKSVEQYGKYEKATLEAITELRSQARTIAEPLQRGEVEERLGNEVRQLIAVAEDYPDLKANENFLQLQAELVETEDYLQFARRYYNGSVRDFNTMIEMFPSNLVAGGFQFTARSFFQKASDEVANVPLVRIGSVEPDDR